MSTHDLLQRDRDSSQFAGNNLDVGFWVATDIRQRRGERHDLAEIDGRSERRFLPEFFADTSQVD